MVDDGTKYNVESEIDKAFPYLDELDKKIYQLEISKKRKLLKESPKNKHKKKFSLLNIFRFHKAKDKKGRTDTPLNLRRKTLKHHEYPKDGYIFRIQLVQRYNENDIYYYEFSVNIKYRESIKKEQFYKKILDLNEAKEYYEKMAGVFRHLKRRDLMEKLFKEKRELIKQLKKQS